MPTASITNPIIAEGPFANFKNGEASPIKSAVTSQCPKLGAGVERFDDSLGADSSVEAEFVPPSCDGAATATLLFSCFALCEIQMGTAPIETAA